MATRQKKGKVTFAHPVFSFSFRLLPFLFVYFVELVRDALSPLGGVGVVVV